MNERKAITDWLRSRRASEPMLWTIERLADLIDQGKHLEQMSHENCTKPDGNKGCIDCVAYGAVEEQERIIKLLEAGSRDSNPLDDIYDGVMYGFIKRAEFKQRLIALINGETK